MGEGEKLRITLKSFTAQSQGAEIAVTAVIDNGTNSESMRLVLLARSFSELRPQKGDISEEEFERLITAAKLCSAVKRGMNILSYGANSKKNLALKLRNKGFEREISELAADYLFDMGYINEHSDAQREAEICLKKLWGRKRIFSVLKAKGFSDEAIAFAMESLGETDFSVLCSAALKKKYRQPISSPEEAQKAFAAMQRLGFSSSEIRFAIKEHMC